MAETQSLIDWALRHVSIEFKQAVRPDALADLPGVTVLSWSDTTRVTLQVEGDMEGLINALSGLPLCDLETSKPSLEEVFMRYYES